MLGVERVVDTNIMKKENLRFNAELTFEEKKLEDIPCELVFPKTQDEKVVLIAQSNNSEFLASKIPFTFSLKATFSNQRGNLLEVFADKVYNLGTKIPHFATNQEFRILEAEPVNLKIREFTQRERDDNRENQK